MKLAIFVLLSLAVLSFAQDDGIAVDCIEWFCEPECPDASDSECATFNDTNRCYNSIIYGNTDTEDDCEELFPTLFPRMSACAQNVCGNGNSIGYCLLDFASERLRYCQSDRYCNKYFNCVTQDCDPANVTCRQQCITEPTVNVLQLEKDINYCLANNQTAKNPEVPLVDPIDCMLEHCNAHPAEPEYERFASSECSYLLSWGHFNTYDADCLTKYPIIAISQRECALEHCSRDAYTNKRITKYVPETTAATN